jgi:hypothetical protein
MSWKVFAVGLMLSAAVFGQSQSVQSQSSQPQSGDSVADVARANRAKVQAQEASGATPKMITNQELPAGSVPAAESGPLDDMTTVSGVKKSDRSGDQRLNQRLMAEQRVSGQWKARLQDQEARIADLQARIDRITAALHAAIGTAQYDTPVNRYQMIQTDRLAQMQETLSQQKEKLAQMQDAARRAGVGQ